ncbi:hypothetical protein A2209_03550 [Candidatus Roizmanbacteria bacterium RIFOXYA1_FULL_41_12]|uniref:Small-conductance mechanosensitive ion channel n=1 Tax=Candidatus Roizmanbacteria bacterium RIFOXYA1_FULL_41_12 TaxID=1802082 RepID=A0A1F7K9T9_9BACT|nr:MAG: hypothetical protein A2262_02835 [Candidatus Roizmanbacteria bacterium RIFOXYA2_FULL_41_8]OGK64638.1 MAG: hypothetical protein A2209_03550 [Candidatus Roizmanbacteria bacterium RIFOXYA1_FULL_41_12]OGK67184.1 MAG: hypothetical protein A2377_00930 [Candidatus Roizmanbacteria bacterium RIFOXYB1_FULL_41_27]OGK75251.1 MAG: hypothetical protein A2575_01520 [Candidatus Roizmanbacteria bacterium RIFOXYD1_FULL_41_24]OGK75301.1 MAG: hypothetical protein A2459_02180 [Candidatus Roizmanbacteria bac
MNPVIDVFASFYKKTLLYLPNFFYGLLVLILGLLLSSIVKQLFISLVSFIKLSKLLKNAKIANEKTISVWIEVLAELLRWVTVILFLMPTVEVWGLSRMVTVLNSLLFYLPNVIVAVIVGLIGYIVANLAYDIVLNSVNTLQKGFAKTIAAGARSSIIVFTSLIILNQLGVAQDLIRILFTGIVFMLALAGGLAFGLGGKEFAQTLLKNLLKELKK